MKTSISSDVWEKKKGLIAKLYMEEEWPLKQVIKQIRSDDFNPSETQLRSRLKKWRVTKPSRQTRKKTQASSSSAEPDSDRDVTRKPSIQRPLPRDPPRARHDWPGAQSIYTPVSEDPPHSKWNSPLAQQLTPSPSGEHALVSDRSAVHSHSYPDLSPTTTSFDHAHASPVGEALMVNTTSAVAPSYPAGSAYPLSPESCLPSPGGTANTTPGGIAWPPRASSADYGLNPAQWYQLPFEAITPPNGVAQSTAPMAPSLAGYLPPISGHVYQPQYSHYQGEASEYHHGYGDKNWKRAMSLQYDMGGHPALGRAEHVERKQIHHRQPQTVMSPSHTQSGPQSVMCAPMPYMGQDHYQKPPGIGY
ncbi:hypothetical protein N7467_000210 [Penicillium canescens]|nr:hypothetical protein N7467_000210 [Penicillium canescens]